MKHEDAKAILYRLARKSARQAIMNGDNPLFLLYGHTGGAREIMREAIIEEMRDAVKRVVEDAAFYRKMNSELVVRQ